MSDAIDPAPRRPMTPGERAGVGVAIVVFTAVVFADLVASSRTAAWSVPFMLATWVPLLVLHETGHAVAARLVGWGVDEYSIGFGKALLRFRVGPTRVVVRRVPLEGFVVPRPVRSPGFRARNAFVFAAGPLAEIALLAVLVGLVGYDTMTTPSDHLGLIALQSVGAAILLGLFFNLIPHVTSDGRRSDGLGIAQSLFMTPDEVELAVTRPIVGDADRLIDDDRPEAAMERIASALASAPDSVPLRLARARALAATGDGVGASEELVDVQHGETLGALMQWLLWKTAAELALLAPEPEPEILRDAELAVDHALELLPGDAELGVTRGAILVERGRLEEGIATLQRAERASRDAPVETLCLTYLAIAAHRVGDAASKEAYVERLRELEPSPRELKRLQREIG